MYRFTVSYDLVGGRGKSYKVGKDVVYDADIDDALSRAEWLLYQGYKRVTIQGRNSYGTWEEVATKRAFRYQNY